jgi:branched-chain amino acid transport system permease protein
VLVAAFAASMLGCGLLGVAIERVALRPLRGVKGPAAMITTIGVSYILYNGVLLGFGAQSRNFPNPLARHQFAIGGATLELRQILVFAVSAVLMAGLYAFTARTRLVMTAFFLGSALAGAGGLIFGLYYNFTAFGIGFTTGLRAFTAAVLGGIGNIPGAMVGGIAIGLIEALGSQFIAASWADVIIFSILVLVLVFRPAGLFGTLEPQKS